MLKRPYKNYVLTTQTTAPGGDMFWRQTFKFSADWLIDGYMDRLIDG